MIDECIVNIEREVPSEGYKDFNDELIDRDNEQSRKAVGTDIDGDGDVEVEESFEEKHFRHR